VVTPGVEARPSRVAPGVGTSDAASFLRLEADDMAAFVHSGGRVEATPSERLRILVMLGRPRTCLPGLLAYVLGVSYTAGAPPGRMVLGALLAACIALSANLHNTATDLYEDSRNLPGRVLLLAKLGYRPLLSFCKALGLAMLLGAAMLGWTFAVFMALAVVGMHQYSAPPVRSKGRPVLGLWVFAQAVVFPFLFGWSTAPGDMLATFLGACVAPLRGHAPPPGEALWPCWRVLGMWLFLTLWFMAKGAFKNVPDFDGDKAAGVRTSATLCRSRRAAALVAAAATLAAYLSLAALVALGLEKPRALLALLWLVPVTANLVRLVRAPDGVAGNELLRTDMTISTGFIASLLLLVAPGPAGIVAVGAAGLVLVATDLLGLDSRRGVDASGRWPTRP